MQEPQIRGYSRAAPSLLILLKAIMTLLHYVMNQPFQTTKKAHDTWTTKTTWQALSSSRAVHCTIQQVAYHVDVACNSAAYAAG